MHCQRPAGRVVPEQPVRPRGTGDRGDIAWHYVDDCVRALNAGELSAKAKWWCTQLQGREVDACLQLHGGYGYLTEYPIARAFADDRTTRIYRGTTESMKEVVGRDLGAVALDAPSSVPYTQSRPPPAGSTGTTTGVCTAPLG
ncbi:acyl-CoA dehydrogenase family protein [Nocardioides sp.]|uniref:acyl-CoA dehydrogenase family protein n=1 Tax=Nocardioides sp. TaxID=35761 RepID=UPI002736B822|nr:acyl-CoA dehydrogenase family protein [Nocardioides sp.]MDP3891699.1 acyl-CoA dehydrogenase family protein [Nocardioides sp.]